MNLDYIINSRTNGANPFKIFESLQDFNPDSICWAIKRMPYDSFLDSAYWFAVSMVAKSKAGMRCQVCNSGIEIAVHHRTYDNHGKEHINMSDLVVLCGNCHGLFHGHSVSVPKIDEPNQKHKRLKVPKRTIIPHSESDLKMPDGEEIILTSELISNCRANGSFTNSTLRAFGLSKPLVAGWPARLVGKKLTRSEYHAALKGKYIYNSGPL